MTKVQVLYWHGIPLQVRAGERRERVSLELPSRFQEAVDKAAMAAGLIGTDDYLAGLVWEKANDRDGAPAEVAAKIVTELEAHYPSIDWRQTADRIKETRSADA